MEVRVFFWAPIQIQGHDLEFHKNPRKRVFAFLAFKNFMNVSTAPVGAAEGWDLLIFSCFNCTNNQDQKIAAFGSSYGRSSGVPPLAHKP
ncbi:hypothetical protein [Pseudomonas sp. A-RE-19]|uniref:hypothetical protein n=1 Tax=Pseudomonas sp. A-RE-19 TaxID=2832401 RepID=UPI001CBB5E91|nr:hypothetical protein [Pseudomonas sp. A-RE-19]